MAPAPPAVKVGLLVWCPTVDEPREIVVRKSRTVMPGNPAARIQQRLVCDGCGQVPRGGDR